MSYLVDVLPEGRPACPCPPPSGRGREGSLGGSPHPPGQGRQVVHGHWTQMGLQAHFKIRTCISFKQAQAHCPGMKVNVGPIIIV